MKSARPATLAVLLAAAAAVPGMAQTRPAAATRPAGNADVPVRAIVLYSSGVGYFEHFGTVRGDASAHLQFKARQINDVLKSLILQDQDGGQVRAVTYPSQDPIAKTLKSFQVDVTGNPPLADFLNQLRGAKVTVTVGADDTTGTVMGVEAKTIVVHGKDGDRAVDQHVLNLVSRRKIVSVPLENVAGVQLDDPRLQDELDRALATVAGSRDADKKPVDIEFAGRGERRVRLGYVVETPVWKTSYRLVLPPAADGPATRPAGGQLQGWAIVENQTDNDWTNVQLSLVSGRPISFVEDLYQPLYVPRPVVEPDLFASLRPPTYAGGQTAGSDQPATTAPAAPPPPGSAENGVTVDQLQRRMDARRRAAQGNQGQNNNLFSGGGGGQDEEAKPPMDPTASVKSLASANSLGELFEYTVGNVTLPRQRSAMIPIVTDAIDVERVSIYNPTVLPRNPLTGARVRNTTDKLLLAGPVTVLDGSAYAGDAQVDDVQAGQERLLSFGVDLQLLVDATDASTDEVVTAKVVKGTVTVTHRVRQGQRYAAQNKSKREKVLIVEHPRQGGEWKLVDSPAPFEQTDAVYRFRTTVPPGRSMTVAVAEQLTRDESSEIAQLNDDGVASYRRTGGLPKAVADALARVAELRAATVDTRRKIDAGKQRLTDITAEQGRIRDNLRSVQQASQYYARLMGKLNDQETAIEKADADTDALQAQLDGQQNELDAYVAGLNVP